MEENATPDARERRDVAGMVAPAVAGISVPAESPGCATCGQPNPPLSAQVISTGLGQPVYAVGRVTAQISTPGLERAFAQFTAGAHQGDLVEVELLQRVLGNPETSWLGRHLCFVFASEGIDTFTVLPRDADDVARLAGMLSPAESEEVVHVIVGRTLPGPIDWRCAAPGLPAVQADRVLAFTLQEFAAAIPHDQPSDGAEATRSDTGSAEFQATVRRVFHRLTRSAGNHGLAPVHIARNYAACEFAGLYHAVAQAQSDGQVLVGFDAQHAHSADRSVVSLRVTFRHPRTDIIERLQCFVDVTEPSLPFLMTKLQRVY